MANEPHNEHHAAVSKRLKSIAGHVNGIDRMVNDDAYCIDIIKQIQAVQAALNKVNDLMLEHHLNTCVIEAVRGDNKNERERVLGEIVDVFEMAQKI
jgi:DNA-binding FrmR family transcriptional regulator